MDELLEMFPRYKNRKGDPSHHSNRVYDRAWVIWMLRHWGLPNELIYEVIHHLRKGHFSGLTVKWVDSKV